MNTSIEQTTTFFVAGYLATIHIQVIQNTLSPCNINRSPRINMRALVMDKSVNNTYERMEYENSVSVNASVDIQSIYIHKYVYE